MSVLDDAKAIIPLDSERPVLLCAMHVSVAGAQGVCYSGGVSRSIWESCGSARRLLLALFAGH